MGSIEVQDRKCCQNGCSDWCRRYFWEGQELDDITTAKIEKTQLSSKSGFKGFMEKYRRILALLIPAILVEVLWVSVLSSHDLWHLFVEHWPITIMMIFGSFIAGMTSEGGGAVAFPVMTLILGVSPSVARDFSVMIQSIGMSCASFSILYMGVVLEWHSIIFCSLGGFFGTILGLYVVDPNLTPAQKKLGFVSVWFSFAFALFLMNCTHGRKTFKKIPDFRVWKGCFLFATGIAGGIFTSFAGNGIDICSFSILTLFFRISEKVATPTSVILMAVNSILTSFWRIVVMYEVDTTTWEYFACAVPVVVIGAPCGSILGSHFHRLVLAGCLYILDVVALITAFAVVPLTPVLIGSSIGTILIGFIFFGILTFAGHKMLSTVKSDEVEETKL